MTDELFTVQKLKSYEEGQTCAFRTLLLFHKATVRNARNGSEFLVVEAGDRTGSFTFNCFGNTATFDLFHGLTPGTVVEVNGNVEFFNGRFSPRINSARPLDPEEVEADGLMAHLVEVPPEPVEALWEELNGYVEAIEHEGLRATVQNALEHSGERLKVSPAAIAMHHAYRHGLLEHTTHVARAANALFPLYPEVDPSLALAGAILHDIGKTLEYAGDDAASKTRAGILQGHVVLGYRLARQAALKAKLDPSLVERLEHIILSHQGEMEWGAAAMAATPEAVFVSMIDNLDAKMGMVQRALRNSPENQDFSDKIHGLQTNLYLPQAQTEPIEDAGSVPED